jgi:hypothetical protein
VRATPPGRKKNPLPALLTLDYFQIDRKTLHSLLLSLKSGGPTRCGGIASDFEADETENVPRQLERSRGFTWTERMGRGLSSR